MASVAVPFGIIRTVTSSWPSTPPTTSAARRHRLRRAAAAGAAPRPENQRFPLPQPAVVHIHLGHIGFMSVAVRARRELPPPPQHDPRHGLADPDSSCPGDVHPARPGDRAEAASRRAASAISPPGRDAAPSTTAPSSSMAPLGALPDLRAHFVPRHPAGAGDDKFVPFSRLNAEEEVHSGEGVPRTPVGIIRGKSGRGDAREERRGGGWYNLP